MGALFPSRLVKIVCSLWLAGWGLVPGWAAAQTANPPAPKRWALYISPYAYHYSDAKKENSFEPDEQKHAYVWGLGAEYAFNERYFAGLFAFNNSFGQPSQYLYGGAQFTPLEGSPDFFVKISAGILHGYKPPYHKKIPVNTRSGWGLGVVPAVGWRFNDRIAAQVNILGTAGLGLQWSYAFGQ